MSGNVRGFRHGTMIRHTFKSSEPAAEYGNSQKSQVVKTENRTPVTVPVEPWIDSNQACLHLGISHVTLRRWIKAKRLTPKRTPGGEFRFRRPELDALLQ